MMSSDPFADIDLAPYQTAPQLPLQTLVVLIKSLAARLPGDSPPYIIAAEADMRAAAEQAEAAMIARLRETNEPTVAEDLDFDNALDGLWGLFRDRTRAWARYQRPGLDFLLDDDKLEIDFEALREKAGRARELGTRLFGDGPLDMLNKAYPEQSQLMANVLGLIDTDELGDDALEIAGDELLPILRRCQQRYQAMVNRRSAPESSARVDLRTMRALLQRRIVRYSTLLLTMVDASKPETRELVLAALQPMITLRPSPRSAGSDAADNQALPDVVAAAAAAEQA